MLELVVVGGVVVGSALGIKRLVGYLIDRVRRPVDNAWEALRARGFDCTHGTMSVRRDVVIALTADGRVALCDLGRGGRVAATHVVDRGALEVTALEDGLPLDEGRGVPRTGVLALRVVLAGRARDVVFAVRVPQSEDQPPDMTAFAGLRRMVAWWRDALGGRPPDGPYPLAPLLAIYAFGSVSLELAAAQLADERRDRLPLAKVVPRR